MGEDAVRVLGGEQWAALGRTYSGHSDYVRTLAWSPDGSRIASGSDDTDGAGVGGEQWAASTHL